VFVGDVARAVTSALESTGSDVLNVGTGVESDVNTLFHELNRLTGAHAEEQHAPAKPGEQQRSVLDTSKIAERLGWQAEVALPEGLEQTVDWFRARREAPSAA